jgi:chromosome segregation ATPase
MPLEKFLEFAGIVRQFIADAAVREGAKDLQITELLERIASLESQLSTALANLAIALANDASDAEAIAKAEADARAAREAANSAAIELTASQAQLQQAIEDRASSDASLLNAIATLQAEFQPVS